MRSTPTRSRSSCCAAGPVTRCWPGSAPAGAVRGKRMAAPADSPAPTRWRVTARSGVPPRVLARQALAWRQGGLAGLELLRAEWDPAAEDPDAAGLLEAARAVLRAKTGAADVVVGNRVTAGRLQLRLGRDLR